MRNTISLLHEPKGAAYAALLNSVSALSQSAQLVVRHGSSSLNDDGTRRVEALSHFLVEKVQGNSWPGTQLMDETATIYCYWANEFFVDAVLKYSDGLYEWMHPNAPEDLCFLREDGSPVLASIAHERDSWLELDDVEAGEVFSDSLVLGLVESPVRG